MHIVLACMDISLQKWVNHCEYTLDASQQLFFFFRHPQILHCFIAINKYRNVYERLCALCSHACTYHLRRAKIFLSIHWTLMSKFYFLHHPRIQHCLKAITKYRNVHACLCLLCLHAYTYHSQFLLAHP